MTRSTRWKKRIRETSFLLRWSTRNNTHSTPPQNPARKGENDCRVLANYKLQYREEDFLSERVRPIEQADLARNSSGAKWIVGDEIEPCRYWTPHLMGSTRWGVHSLMYA